MRFQKKQQPFVRLYPILFQEPKTAGNLRISGFFLCNLHKDVSLAPFPCNYFATFQNVPKGRKDQHVVVLQFLTTTYCIFLQVTFWLRNK